MLVGQVIAGSPPDPEKAVSSTWTPWAVTLPLLTTANVYVMASPAAFTKPVSAVFVSVSRARGVCGVVTVESPETTGPEGAVPDACAVLISEPESTSA